MRNLFTSWLLVICAVAVAAQQPAAPAQQTQPPVTFRVEVNYVEIDATVVDAEGKFVRGLTRDDFQILEQGKPQKVETVSLVDIPVERADAPLFAASPIEPDARSNRREFDGRLFVIVLDTLHTDFRRSPRVRNAAKLFIQRYMGANDVAAVVTTGGSRAGMQEFTSNKRLLVQAADKFMGQKNRSATLEKLDDYERARRMNESPVDSLEMNRAHRATTTMRALRSLAEYVGGIRGRRKAVVFFSEGIDYDINNPIESKYALDVLEETRLAIAAATRGNVAFYTVDPRGLDAMSEVMDIQSMPVEETQLGMTTMMNEVRTAQDSLRVVAEQTGGFSIINRNEYGDAFGRIISDNSSYYVIGYYSSDNNRDGKFRPLDVRVTRPGLRVRARKGYTAPKGNPPTARAGFAPESSRELRDVLDSPIPVAGLGLTATAAAFRGKNKDASIAVALEIDGRRLQFKETNGQLAGEVELAIVAFDDGGRARDGGHDRVTMTPRPQTRDIIQRNGIRVIRRIDVPPGRYQVRIAAREPNGGAMGSVHLDVQVPDFSKGPLVMSGVVLASAYASSVPTARADDELKGVLPAPQTAIREFPQNDTLSLFAEIYDNETRTPHKVAIKTTVLGDDGNVMFTHADERQSSELGGTKGGYGYLATVPLKGMRPGRYVLRVEAQSTLSTGATATRELEFTIR